MRKRLFFPSPLPQGAGDDVMGERIHLHHDGLSRPLENPKLRVLSLGAGVQSSTLALMAARGEIEAPDCAIFSDTQWEPPNVYEWLNWLEKQLSFPVYRVTAGSLREAIGAVRPAGKFLKVDIPAYVDSDRGGMLNRSCTQDYKIAPIRKKVRELLGLHGKRSPTDPIAEQWIGISTDEMQRMKHPRERWMHHRWPLIEARMSRQMCLRWMEDRQYPKPPKSSCIGCPFHSNAEWRNIRADPKTWADAIEIDERLRQTMDGKRRSATGTLYLHRSRKPLAEAPIDEADDGNGIFGFLNECEGMCGV